MKKYSAIALMLAAALTLSACGTSENIQPENGVGTPSQTTGENTPEENAGENTEEQQPQPEIPEDVQNVIDMFDTDSFTAPDGTEVMLTEASCQIGDSALFFDFAYIAYAFPIYSDTVTDPKLYDFETFEFREDAFIPLEHKPLKVVKGDLLDNGMTVIEAKYGVMPAADGAVVVANEVTMEGECELEGVLLCFADNNYMFAQNDVLFYPNPVSCPVPMPYRGDEMTKTGTDLKFAFMNDGGEISLGNLHEIDVDIADWFEDYNSYVRVKVTLDGLGIRYSDYRGTQGWSTLKSAEKLDS